MDRTACRECEEEGAQDRAGFQEWGGEGSSLGESTSGGPGEGALLQHRWGMWGPLADSGGLKVEWVVKKLSVT